MALNLVFMGPPGAGKGTQAERFAREHGLPRVSTGDILREEVAAGSEMGRQVQELMARGQLVSDELIIAIVRERLSRPNAERGFVLDGFPRTVPQADALDAMLDGRGPVIVIEIQVPDEELVRRVVSRRICSVCGRIGSALVSASDGKSADGHRPEGTSPLARCATCGGTMVLRSDDNEAVVRDRLKVYWRETQPMIAHYQPRTTYRAVDGAQDPDLVRDDLVAAVAAVLGNPAGEVKKAVGVRSEKNA